MDKKKLAIVIIVVVIIILLGAAGYFSFVRKSELITQQPIPTQDQHLNLPTPDAPTLTFTQGAEPFIQINFDYSIAKLFNIYRSTNATSGWRKIISDFPSNAHTAVDSEYPKDAKILYYRIVSVDERGRESVPSSSTAVQISLPQDTALNLKTYTNAQYEFEFKYNPNWSIATINTGSEYDTAKPYVLLWTGSVSDAPCQDMGCPPRSGDRDELTKGITLEGAPPLYPWFKILRVRGDKWIALQVTDVDTDCASETACQQYISSAPLSQMKKMDNADYQTYNGFIELISTLKFPN